MMELHISERFNDFIEVFNNDVTAIYCGFDFGRGIMIYGYGTKKMAYTLVCRTPAEIVEVDFRAPLKTPDAALIRPANILIYNE